MAVESAERPVMRDMALVVVSGDLELVSLRGRSPLLSVSEDPRKNGAALGFSGGAMGLLRARMTSKFKSVCQRERGRSDKVRRADESWSVDVPLAGASGAASSEKSATSRAGNGTSEDVVDVRSIMPVSSEIGCEEMLV